MGRIASIVMVLVVAMLLSQRALGADGRETFGELVLDDKAVHMGFGSERDVQPGDDRVPSATGRSLHGWRRLFHFDPYDSGYDDPICNADVRDYDPNECPWRQ